MPPEDNQEIDNTQEENSEEENSDNVVEEIENSEEELEEEEPEEKIASDRADKTEADKKAIEIQEALQVYNALKDPQSAKNIIEMVADRHGLNLSPNTKREEKSTKRDIVNILEETLGEDYKFLASKIGPAIEQSINMKLQEVKDSQMERDVDSAISWLSKETSGDSEKYINEIATLSNELTMPPNGNIKRYLKRLYSIASAGKVKSATKKGIVSKIAKNRKDAGDRLASSSSSGAGKPTSKPADNIHGAVQLAMKQLKMTE